MAQLELSRPPYILQSVRPSSVKSEVRRLIITVTWVAYIESKIGLTDTSYENVVIIVSEGTKAANQIFVKIDLREG